MKWSRVWMRCQRISLQNGSRRNEAVGFSHPEIGVVEKT
jgi:hypothetical protein